MASAFRKRKKGGLLLEADEKEEEKAQQNGEEPKEEEVDDIEQIERRREEEEKKKEDALWASFLSDVGQKPKAVAATQGTQIKKVRGHPGRVGRAWRFRACPLLGSGWYWVLDRAVKRLGLPLPPLLCETHIP